jgi:hypothetical protein
LLGLSQPPVEFGRVDLADHLASPHRVALANLQALQFAGDLGLDHGRAHGPQAA